MSNKTVVGLLMIALTIAAGVAVAVTLTFAFQGPSKEQHVKELFHAKYGDNVVIDTFGFYEAAAFEYTAETTSGLIIRMNNRFWILLREPIQE